MKNITIGLLICLAFLVGTAFADRGMIPHDPSVQLFEPNQRAMIAWNGQEELLLLTTDVRASAKTRVLEVLPLPSEPTITKGSLDTFRRATSIINKHQRRISRKRNGGSKGIGADSRSQSAGEITFHKQIGAHDVSVAKVISPDGFVGWVESALKKEGVKNPVVPAWMKAKVQEYLKDGFKWFVFDSVELTPTMHSATPLYYRFKTNRLFYPLKITKVSGPTKVNLIILTPKLLREFPGVPLSQVKLEHKPIPITSSELEFIDKKMSGLLGRQSNMKLRIWKLFDYGKGFNKDLIAY